MNACSEILSMLYSFIYIHFSPNFCWDNNCTFPMMVEKEVPLEILPHLFRDGWLVIFLQQHVLPDKRARKQVVLVGGGIFFGIISERWIMSIFLKKSFCRLSPLRERLSSLLKVGRVFFNLIRVLFSCSHYPEFSYKWPLQFTTFQSYE